MATKADTAVDLTKNGPGDLEITITDPKRFAARAESAYRKEEQAKEKPGNPEEEKEKQTKPQEQKEQIESPSESSEIPTGADDWLNRSLTRIVDAFQEGGWFQRIAIAGIVTAGTYLGIQTAKKFAKTLSGAISGSEGTASWLGKKLALVSGTTVLGVLGVSLGQGLAGKVMEMCKGKVSDDELLQAAEGGKEGIGKLLAKKATDGTVQFTKGKWDAVSGPLGMPAFEEVTGKVAEIATGAVEWMEERGCDFSKVKTTVVEFFEENNIPGVGWLKGVGSSQMASEMGITPEKATQYLVAGGGALLIFRYMKFKGLAINGAMYLLLFKEGKEGGVGEIMSKTIGGLQEVRDSMMGKLRGEFPAVDYLIPDIIERSDWQNHIDDLLDWTAEHPAEAMLAVNGLWLLRGVIFRGIAKALREGVGFALNNPSKAALAAGGLAVLWHGRREFIKKLVEAGYESPTSEAAQRMLKRLDDLCGVDRSRGATLSEKQIPEYARSILEDPLQALSFKENMERYKNGEFSIVVDGGGKIWLAAKSFSAPIQCAKLTWETIKSIPYIFSPENPEGTMGPALLAGTEVFVFGSMAWGGMKAQHRMFTSLEGQTENFWRGFRSLVPGTQEWRFVLYSAVQEPLIPIFKSYKANKIADITSKLTVIEGLLENPTPENFAKIRDIGLEIQTSTTLSKDFAEMRERLGGTNFDFEFAKRTSYLKLGFSSIRWNSDLGTTSLSPEESRQHAAAIRRRIRTIRADVKDFETSLSHMFERVELVLQGNFKEAFRSRRLELARSGEWREAVRWRLRENPEGEKVREPRNRFEGSPEILEERAKELQTELDKGRGKLSEAEAFRIQKEHNALIAFLKPEETIAQLEGLKTNLATELEGLTPDQKAKRLRDVAAHLDAVNEGVEARANAALLELESGDGKPSMAMMNKMDELRDRFAKPLREGEQALRKEMATIFAALPDHLKTPALEAEVKGQVGVNLRPTDLDFKPEKLFAGEVAEVEAKKNVLLAQLNSPDITPEQKVRVMRDLRALNTFLDPEKGLEGLKSAATGLALRAHNLEPEARITHIKSLCAQLESTERGVQSKFVAEVNEVTAEAKKNGQSMADPEVVKKLQALDEKYSKAFAEQKAHVLRVLTPAYESLRPEQRTRALQKAMKGAWQGIEGGIMAKVARSGAHGAKMVAPMAALHLATKALLIYNDPERGLGDFLDNLGPEMTQILLEALPFVGTGMDLYSTVAGEELVSGADVSGWQYRLMNGFWTIVGAAGDVVTVVGAVPSGGGAVGANVALRLAKMGKKGKKVLKVWNRVEFFARRMGGYMELAGKISKHLDKAKVLKHAENIQTLGGTIGKGIMLVGGVNMVYSMVSSDIPPPPPGIMDDEIHG